MGCCKSGEEVCERCEDVCPCIAGYPQLWALFVLFIVGGLGTLVSSLYAFISLKTSILAFAWKQPFRAYINASALGLAVGMMMLVLALLTWCACRGDTASALFKAFFALMLVLCAAGNIAVAVGASLTYHGFRSQKTKFVDEFERAWMEGAQQANNTAICKIQDRFICQGFESGDCTGRRGGVLARCPQDCKDPPGKGPFYGCREEVVVFYRKWNFPLAILSSFSALACVTAFIITIANVSFNIAKQKGNI